MVGLEVNHGQRVARTAGQQAPTGDLKNLGAHFNNVEACFQLFRFLLDHVGAFRNGGGHRFSPFRAQTDHAPKLPRVDDALMIPIQAVQKCLNILGQAVPRVRGLGLESVPRLARHCDDRDDDAARRCWGGGEERARAGAC